MCSCPRPPPAHTHTHTHSQALFIKLHSSTLAPFFADAECGDAHLVSPGAPLEEGAQHQLRPQVSTACVQLWQSSSAGCLCCRLRLLTALSSGYLPCSMCLSLAVLASFTGAVPPAGSIPCCLEEALQTAPLLPPLCPPLGA